ncbi:hypothetical protein EV143_105177 [Flavobacterium chryseum]|nr:hypothetical protein EV143_105177 [Flavobacterium sp. P3160]
MNTFFQNLHYVNHYDKIRSQKVFIQSKNKNNKYLYKYKYLYLHSNT